MTRLAPLALLTVLACDSGQLTLSDEVTDDTETPGVDDETDGGDTPDDTDPDVPDETDTAGESDETDVVDPGDSGLPAAWEGEERRTYQPFFGDPCVVTVRLAGPRVTGDAARTCGACDHVFRAETRSNGLCPGVSPFSGDVWRGLEDLGNGDVRVWAVTRDAFGRFSAERLGTGTWVNGALAYTFTDEANGWRGVRVVGSATVQ